MTDPVADRLAVVRDRLRSAGADLDAVRICAVTKGFDVDVVRAALAHDLLDVGENYAQELLGKAASLADDPAPAPRWHLIGRLQRNKVRDLAPLVHTWQSVDRPELGAAIARHAPGARVLIQVAATGEEGKGGCPPAGVPALVDDLREQGLDVVGLMAVGPTDPAVDPRPAFSTVASLRDGLGLAELSMGMSGDLEAAVECGTTMVRVGTALFGPRRVVPRAAN